MALLQSQVRGHGSRQTPPMQAQKKNSARPLGAGNFERGLAWKASAR